MRISDWSSDVCSSDLHARGEDVLQKLTDLEHAERSEGRWLEDDRVARGERRRDFPDRQIDREIPRRDRADDAKRHIMCLDALAVALVDHLDRRRHFGIGMRAEEHTSELQSLMRNWYAVFCWTQTQ